MIALFLLLVGAAVLVVLLAFLLGFRLGGQSWVGEVQRIKADAASAQRQMHDLTRAAFVAMAERAQQDPQQR